MKQVKRLFEDFQPEHYELYLEPDRKASVFSGRVKIAGQKTGRPSRRITLHQKVLKIKSAKIVKHDKRTGDTEIQLDRLNLHKSFDELRLHTKETLFPGRYTLELEFSGQIYDQMHGIYPCNFKLDGQNKQLIATQFESHHAREAFPCIDEPEAKATFDLTLITPANETVIANTPAKQQKKSGNKLITSFETTPRMSTYLLAFAYGELGFKEAKTKSGVTVRVYATPDKVGLADFSLNAGVKALEFFEDYFGVPYPMAKLDMIGLPDFSAGAMENWGLITYREQMFYVDPKHSSIETKQIAAMVIAHEISHQWFGNLVTMKWWDDLWLNESFANLMEYRAVDEIFPDWKIWEEFTYRELGSALARDALPTVQAVRTKVNHPDELGSIFDPSIVYAKGGSLLNMVRHLVGEDAFRAGLKSYFQKHKYANTTADDLWNALGKAGGFDIEAMMKNWLEKPGFPLIELDHQPGGRAVKLSQRRLVVGKPADGNTVWQVPLAPSVELSSPMLGQKSAELKVLGRSKTTLTLNHDGHSYLSARYQNPEHFDSILSAVTAGDLSSIDRLLLVQSYLLLERAAEVPTTDNLRLLDAYRDEREEAVWSILSGIMGNVRTLLGKDETAEQKFNTYITPLVKPLIAELGWDGKDSDSSQTQKLRALAISLGAVCQIPQVIEEGLKRFKSFDKPGDLRPDIRSAVYFIAVRHGQPKDFDKLVKLYKTLSSAEEKWEIASELTVTRDEAQLKKLLSMITTDVRPQDAPTWFAWLIRNKYGTDLTWRWLSDNWDWVEAKYGSDKSYDYFPRYTASAFSRPEQLEDYKKFFKDKRNIALARAIKLGIEEIEGRVAWRAKNEAAVRTWLDSQT